MYAVHSPWASMPIAYLGLHNEGSNECHKFCTASFYDLVRAHPSTLNACGIVAVGGCGSKSRSLNSSYS